MQIICVFGNSRKKDFLASATKLLLTGSSPQVYLQINVHLLLKKVKPFLTFPTIVTFILFSLVFFKKSNSYLKMRWLFNAAVEFWKNKFNKEHTFSFMNETWNICHLLSGTMIENNSLLQRKLFPFDSTYGGKKI